MDALTPQQLQKQAELIPMVREALADSPLYIEHICHTLSSSGQSMRTGFDQEGMSSFARGASDLGQFVQLFDHMATLARPIQAEATNAFKQELLECVRAIESALKRQDLVMMSDEIETNLVPLLQGWDAVAQELHAGLESQAIGL